MAAIASNEYANSSWIREACLSSNFLAYKLLAHKCENETSFWTGLRGLFTFSLRKETVRILINHYWPNERCRSDLEYSMRIIKAKREGTR
jgi:hypothetical protein